MQKKNVFDIVPIGINRMSDTSKKQAIIVITCYAFISQTISKINSLNFLINIYIGVKFEQISQIYKQPRSKNLKETTVHFTFTLAD
ncbi:TPA: DUF3021 family protein [Streptococcus suis]|nr:DUF3021 family protein [Streptococcus suis]